MWSGTHWPACHGLLEHNYSAGLLVLLVVGFVVGGAGSDVDPKDKLVGVHTQKQTVKHNTLHMQYKAAKKLYGFTSNIHSKKLKHLFFFFLLFLLVLSQTLFLE